MNARDPETSMLATLLSPRPPAPPPPSAVVRRHRLDDVAPPAPAKPRGEGPPRCAARPVSAEAAPARRAPVSEFSAADKSLIRRLHGYMPLLQLLGVLNERLLADQGDAAPAFTIDQLRTEIAAVSTAVPGGATDWGSLRKLLARARANGLLDRIDEQRIDDFAVAFALNDRQVMSLKDILLNQGDDE